MERVIVKTPHKSLAFSNEVYVASGDSLAEQFVSVNGVVFKARANDGILANQIGLSAWQRDSVNGDVQMTVPCSPFTENPIIYNMELEVAPLKDRRRCDIKEEELDTALRNIFQGFAFTMGQTCGMDFKGNKIKIMVKCIQVLNSSNEESDVTEAKTGILESKSKPMIVISPSPTAHYLNFEQSVKKKGLKLGPDFLQKMGIGGLDEEFTNIFRRAFISRMFPPSVIKKMGLKHAKGMLLYGPPGTGKTLIARQIGAMLDGREPIIINGPEILNKFVGKSEENIRAAFEPAEADQEENGDNADLHVIIFDEIDAICKQRGSSGGSAGGVHDTVVNQLLTKLDGVKQLNNVLVIGMTNRKDMIDSALLRSGRLEVHVQIGLPDELGRLQIFKIHTKGMKQEKKLGTDVDLKELARLTKNYSGAEIAATARSAASFSLAQAIDTSGGGAVLREDVDVSTLQITMDHFLSALDEVAPDFGADEDDLKECLPGGFIEYSDSSAKLLSDASTLVRVVQSKNRTNFLSVLLEGPHGVGKTALAAKIAIESKFPYIKMIRPSDLVGMHEASRVQKINKIFEDAYKSPLSLVILDNIERLIEYVPIGPRFSNHVLQAILVLLTKPPPEDRKLMVIGTTANFRIFEDFDLKQAFNTIITVPRCTEGKHVASVFKELKLDVAPDELESIMRQCPLPLGIKQLLMVIELARQEGSDGIKLPITAKRFMECCAECRLVRASYMLDNM